MDMVRQCLDARFTSVMLDFSAKSFQENSDALRQVVKMARPNRDHRGRGNREDRKSR